MNLSRMEFIPLCNLLGLKLKLLIFEFAYANVVGKRQMVCLLIDREVLQGFLI